MKKIVLALILFLSTLSLPAMCSTSSVKIGSTVYRPRGPVVLNVIGDSANVSFAGNKGRNVGTANFIFQKIVNQITEGAEFDVIAAGDGEDGKVSVTFTDQKVSGRGTVTLITSDEDSTATGKVKILSVESDGSFTFSINAEVSNALKRVTNPLSGNLSGSDSRFGGKVRVSGKIAASKV